jgi:MinD superfamily P-loop ATPase
MIDPIRQPCWMCEGFPCITACEPGVLRQDFPKRMATARIETFSCLAWQGTACTECLDQCPVKHAIALDEGKPRVVDDVCTGCGVCQFVCPAPENAILLMPLSSRPRLPAQGESGMNAMR